jgi:thiol-disulfide isomerase/thioredoxin
LDAATTQQAVEAGALDFDFVDFAGKPRKLSEFRGKFVLLDFWATWCKPCLADIPKLKGLYEKHKASGFEIVGMDSETLGDDDDSGADPEFAKETAERAKQIVATRGVTWTQATAVTAVLVAKNVFNVKVLPTKILIDKEGNVIATLGEKDDLVATIEKLLSEKNK